jgi:hypothetical protein
MNEREKLVLEGKVDTLPESRMQHPKGAKLTELGWSVPIFCANCGASGGWVPEENCNFAFYLCDPCHEKHGTPAGVMAVPDEVFYAEIAAERAAKNKE